MDDCFVILASWRMTDYRLGVPKRLAEAFGEAAVSITVTTLTDVVSFTVGYFNPLEGVSEFCLFSGIIAFSQAAVLFIHGTTHNHSV